MTYIQVTTKGLSVPCLICRQTEGILWHFCNSSPS